MSSFSKELAEFLKNVEGKRIVFTNGCFDLLHPGHVAYLNEARALGDVLVLGLNSDRSVKNLKGSTRPILDQASRKYILENLRMVDFVEIFDEPTPLNLIKHVRPQILVKGGDWKEEDIVGSAEVKGWGGKCMSLSFKDSFSTTNIIEKIQTK